MWQNMKTFTIRITQVPGKEERGDGAEITAFFFFFFYFVERLLQIWEA